MKFRVHNTKEVYQKEIRSITTNNACGSSKIERMRKKKLRNMKRGIIRIVSLEFL